MTEPASQDQIKATIEKHVRKVARSLYEAAKFASDPERYLHDKAERKRLKENLNRSVAQRAHATRTVLLDPGELAEYNALKDRIDREGEKASQDDVARFEELKERARPKAGPSVHILKGQGPLGTDTTVVDKGNEYRPEAALIGDDGFPFMDVRGGGLALINTRDTIAAYLDANAEMRLINPNQFAELNDVQHYLREENTGDGKTRIGVVVSAFTALSDRDRYEVINPVTAAVKLMAPAIAHIGAAGLGVGLGAVLPKPNEIAEGVNKGFELGKAVFENADEARELVGGEERPRKSKGTKIYIIQFSETKEAPEPARTKSKKTSFSCDVKTSRGAAIRLGDVKADLLQLMDSL